MTEMIQSEVQPPQSPPSAKRNRTVWSAAVLVALGLALVLFWPRAKPANAPEEEHHAEEHHAEEVVLEGEVLKAAGIETVEAVASESDTILRTVGTVRANQQRTQHVTPLVSGRVEKVNVVLGDRVKAGDVLAEMSSPMIAELHGKLHEAETRLTIAERNHARVQQPENRVSVLQARARLDEAEASLNRMRKLIELGSGAGKDLTAAETAYKTAKAEFDYQTNIGLSREVQEAKAAFEMARVNLTQIRDGLQSLGVKLDGEHNDRETDIARIKIRSPLSGVVTERLVNGGAGIEAGKPIFTVTGLSDLWVIANVPSTRASELKTGMSANIHFGMSDAPVSSGTLTYLDPTVNSETQTVEARVETANPGERLRIGMFVEVTFEVPGNPPANGNSGSVVVPSRVVQRLGNRFVVFIPKEDEPGAFEVREVEAGDERSGGREILGGLKAGEKVVANGAFTLKTRLQKGELGHDH